ncbi:MAG TPA: hypothetical protein PLQ50_00055 [Candidatus Woesebacteria bacterium]|nr:hypothetical protein [Candidatus Woesebacteria bacterium]
MRNQEQFATLFETIGYRKKEHPVLVIANIEEPQDGLLKTALDELEEWEDEHHKLQVNSEQAHKHLPPPKSWWLELTDFMVMLRVIKYRMGPSFSLTEGDFPVNGQFKGDFSSLKEQTVNLGEGDVAHNLELLFTEIMSLVKHLDINVQADLYARLVNAKLFLNKEARFFQIEPSMNELDIINKRDHTFKALRFLRNFLFETTGVETTLQPWITEFFKEEILDWQHSATALDQMQQKLPLFQRKIKDELVWHLTAQPQTDEFLELKMMIAGAQLVGVKKAANDESKTDIDPNPPALQNQSAGATLAETTIFWN